jgi:hypothetical protein
MLSVTLCNPQPNLRRALAPIRGSTIEEWCFPALTFSGFSGNR